MESQLEEQLTNERINEMDRYGRGNIYNRMQALLKDERLRAFKLVNHGMAMVDDVLDLNIKPLKYLEHIQQIFQQSYSGAIAEISTSEEQAVVDLGHTLSRLASARFPRFTDRAIGKHTYEEVLNFWKMEEKNLQRKGQILDKKTLDEITSGIGGLVASQFLFILDPPRNPYEFIPLAKTYGLAVKLADNLCDFREDIQKGSVNIPKEDIHHVKGIYIEGNQIIQINSDKLALGTEYMRKEYERIQQVFESADNLLLRARLRRPIWDRKLDERLCLFGRLCRTWLNQARDFMATETLRKYDIHLHSEIPLLAADDLHEIEKKYVSIRDIILDSYRQESENTQLVRNSNPSYNPYSHEKTPEANERIKALVQNFPEIQEVLDFGCDDGERTVELYSGKRLYGIELVKTAVNKSRKRGINMYLGSMIDDVYRDYANPKGRKFDLVSVVGEMVNFVGLDTDTLLARAVEQVRDDGYLLVTCMHPKFEEGNEGKYVVWSHTKSAQEKWLLDKAKIPRTFLLLSEQGLRQRLDKVGHSLECKLHIQGNSILSNYYEDMPLAIYLFRKEK